MRFQKIISVITMCAIVSGTALSVHAVDTADTTSNTIAYSETDGVLSAYAEQVAVLVNQERAANGLEPLRFSPQLSEAASVRAAELPQSFSHTRPDGTNCFTAITDIGISYRSAAENIAYGQRDPESVMEAWMNSSGHRANILHENMDYIGVGVGYQNGVYYWSQFFAASDQLYAGSYLPGESTETSATTTTIVQTTTSKSTTTEPKTTSVSSASEVQTQTTTVLDTNQPIETSNAVETTCTALVTAASDAAAAPAESTASVVTSETKETTVIASAEPTVTSETATTTCPDFSLPIVTIPIPFGDNCYGIGGGVIIVNGCEVQ